MCRMLLNSTPCFVHLSVGRSVGRLVCQSFFLPFFYLTAPAKMLQWPQIWPLPPRLGLPCIRPCWINKVIFTSHISVIFGNNLRNFFLEPFYMKDYLFMNKEWAKMTLKQCFHVQKWKNGLFWSEFFLEPFFPMKLFIEGQKILHDSNCIE